MFWKAALGVKLGIRDIISLSNVHVVALDTAAFGNADAAAPDSSRDDVPLGSREVAPLANAVIVPLGNSDAVASASRDDVALENALTEIDMPRRWFWVAFMVCTGVSLEVMADAVLVVTAEGPSLDP